MSFAKKAEEIGSLVGIAAGIAVVVPLALIEGAVGDNKNFPVTSPLMETAVKIGDAVGRFVVKDGPRIVASALVGDLVDVALPWPGKDDGGCA